jgi:antirestriction protein ArdC
MATTKKALHAEVAEKLIEALRAGTAPWQVPWNTSGVPAFQLPYNAISGNRYKGINSLSLLLSRQSDARWVTFNQAKDNGWQVRKGAKASPIQYVKLTEERTKRDGQGRVVKDDQGKPQKITVKLDRPIIISAWVFNAAQVEGIPELIRPELPELGWQPLERAEQLLQNSGAVIRHKAGDEGYYSPLADDITLPLKAQFIEPARYYATALHELGHWTGHETRLDRSVMNRFGSPDYAREELRAEIASMLIGQELQIGHDPGQHAAYVDSWISLLTDHPFEIHSAAADAEKIYHYLLEMERKRGVDLAAFAGDHKLSRQFLTMGDHIAYNNTIYRVDSLLKNNRVRVEDTGTGRQLVVSRKDGLYHSLLNALQLQGPLTIADLRNEEPKAIETVNHYTLKR